MNVLLTPAALAGAGAGAAVMLAAGAVVLLFRRKAAQKRNARRDRIITAVQEKITDIDSLIGSYRAGKTSLDEFKESLSEKIEIINRTYKPGMHLLDIFFVKYTEKLIEDYFRMIETGVVDLSLRETVAFTVSPLSRIVRKEKKGMAEEATVISPAAAKAGEPEPPAPEPLPEISGDAVLSAMAESAEDKKEPPLEAFLAEEKSSASSVIGATAGIAEPAEEEKESEPFALDGEMTEETARTEAASKESAKPVSAPETAPADSGFAEETMIIDKERQFTFPEKMQEEAAATVVEKEQRTAKPRKDEDETLAAAAVSFPVRIPTPSHGMPPKPVAPAKKPARVPEIHEETLPQPSTICDIEAETIIADRGELLNAGKPSPQQQPEKSQIGITGDDVSDMLDQFFGSKK